MGCICGSDRGDLYDSVDLWGERSILQCLSCDTLRMEPQVPPDQIHQYFGAEYFDEPSVWGERREPVFRGVMETLVEVGVRTVLDVGTGHGHFVAYLERRTFEATGVDISPRAVEWGRRHLGVDVRCGTIRSVDDGWDAIVALDTLYYVHDPVQWLRDARRRADTLVLRCRNPRTPVTGTYALPHQWCFSPLGLRRALRSAGWKGVRQRPARASRHWSHLPREGVRRLNCILRRRLDVGIWTVSYIAVASRRPIDIQPDVELEHLEEGASRRS